ncbi:MAG TPA: AAA family ATPase, partial [Gammaproteobacteria bacterium]|nr:AAA family ATPase [Gammaproteobacteria bacterium]
ELDRRLKHHHWRQLRQRITFSYQLTPLDETAVRAYVQHRLNVAGYRGRPLFSVAALKIVRRASHGTPRLVNILCHKAMLAAYGRGQASIEAGHIRSAVRDTEGAVYRWWEFRLPGWLPAMTAVLLIGLVWLGVRQ